MIKPKKSMGQNFLTSVGALNAIVEAADIKKGEVILEAGPGKGVLTKELLKKGAQVIAVEKDDRLAEYIKEIFDPEMKDGKLVLVHADILDFEIKLIMHGITHWKLISNIPYYITGQFLRKFLSARAQPERMVLILQKEVVERILAKDGKESILSLSVKAYGKPRFVQTIKAGSFTPMPKVDSAIVSIENISKEFFKGFTEDGFFSLVRAGFASKRKKLTSNLSGEFPKEKVLLAFEELGLDPNTRAEDVKLETWQKLSEKIL
ncbi:MAG: 16S rRNA (adenine(1518)-N(6)/adenine(1519)-N(6))-dimethyltransferase RsmA [Parcubacteria group bacterium]